MKLKLIILYVFFHSLTAFNFGSFSNNSSDLFYISRENFTKISDVAISFTTDPNSIEENCVIFVNAAYLENFFNKIYPNIKNRFILITHGSDLSMPGKYFYALENDKLIAWFAQNAESTHPKLHPIPIGMGYSFYNCDTTILNRVKNMHLPKKHLLYMNFNKGTHKERYKVFDIFKNKAYCYQPQRVEFHKYLNDLASSYFVLSPQGTGLDCFRTWEALYMGAIPIVKSSSLNPLYDDLPVLVIEDWNCLTEEYLVEKYKE